MTEPLTFHGHDGRDTVLVPGTPKPKFILGLDLGQVADFTALSIVERVRVGDDPATYSVRHLERYPLGQSYVVMVEQVAAMLARPELGENPALAIDQTGVGRPIFDLFKAKLHGTRLVGITIHGGDSVYSDGNQYSVPKRNLVGTVQALLQTGRLKIAPALPTVDLLTSELQSFAVKLSASGHDSYSARDGEHDDLVLSVAVALWCGENAMRRVMWF